MSKSPNFVTDAAGAAQVLGISRRQFDRLAKANLLPRTAPRRFDLAEVVPAYVRYIEAGREGAATIADAKLISERERGRKLNIENEIAVGRLIYVEHVSQSLMSVMASAVGLLEAIPSRYAHVVAPISDLGETRAQLQAIIREFRENYAAAIGDLSDRLAAGRPLNE